MSTLTGWEIFVLSIIHHVARGTRQYNLANTTFIRLLIECVAHHNNWETLWIKDKNNPYRDLIVLKSLNADPDIIAAPSILIPMPILQPSVTEMLYDACLAEKTVILRKAGCRLPIENINMAHLDRMWDLFFQIVQPEKATALVRHNFVCDRAEAIVAEIEQRAPKQLFEVKVSWVDVLPMSLTVSSVLAQNSNNAIEKIQKIFTQTPTDAI